MSNSKGNELKEGQQNDTQQESTQEFGNITPKIRTCAEPFGDDAKKKIARLEPEEMSMTTPSLPNPSTSDKNDTHVSLTKKRKGEKANSFDNLSNKLEQFPNNPDPAVRNKRGGDLGSEKALLEDLKALAYAPPTPYVHLDEERKKDKIVFYEPNQNQQTDLISHARDLSNDEGVHPGPVRVRGIDWDGDEEDDDYQTVNFVGTNSESETGMEIVEADLVDLQAEEARIMAGIVSRTVQGTLVEESHPKLFNNRNVTILLVILLIIFIGVITLVFVFLLKPIPSDEGTTERSPIGLLITISNEEDLLHKGSPQNLAYSRLLEENIFDVAPDRIFTERYISLVFYFSTNGTYWNDDYGFKEKTSVCDWSKESGPGLTCNVGAEITMIVLGENNLSGTLPSELFQLSSLEKLILPNNTLYGSIPSKFGLQNLAVLDLSFNALTGTLPNIITSSKTIREIYLRSNNLNGTIPDFKAFNGLTKIDFGNNLLTGSISESISVLSSLTMFDLEVNQLVGSIPEAIGQMTSLERLVLGGNFLTGSIPFHIKYLEDLRFIDIESNWLTGKIPEGIEEMGALTVVKFERNHLTGTIPRGLALLQNINHIDLSMNKLTGTLPTEFASLENLILLEIHRNNITDSLEEMFCSNQQKPFLKADCLGLKPEIVCSCCDSCYNDAGYYVPANGDVCGFKSVAELWLKGGLKREADCDCVDRDRLLQCKFLANAPCEACNADETFCLTVNKLAFEIAQDGVHTDAVVTVNGSYTKGLNNSIAIRSAPIGSFCEVSIDGKLCESCNLRPCGPSGERAPTINCGTIDGVSHGVFDGCTDTTMDGGTTSDVFSLIQWMVAGNLYSEESCMVPNIFDSSSIPGL